MMSKTELTFSDVRDAVASLLKHGKERERYHAILSGVEMHISPQDFKLRVFIPAGQYNRAGTVEMDGTPALEWVADACREKAKRERVK